MKGIILAGGAGIGSPAKLDTSILSRLGLEEHDYYVLVARAAPENHVLEILNWFSLSRTKRKLLLVTSLRNDNYSKDIKETILKDSRLVFAGPIYEKETIGSIRYFAYGCLHGHSVGGTNPSLLESLGAGCPAICFDVPFNCEVAGDSSVYFSNRDTFLKAIYTFEELEFERDKFSKRAIEIVKSSYDWEFVTRFYEAVALHLLVFHNRFKLDDYYEWLSRCRHRDSLLSGNLGRFNKDKIIGSPELNEK